VYHGSPKRREASGLAEANSCECAGSERIVILLW
jgi:hypothetical protein